MDSRHQRGTKAGSKKSLLGVTPLDVPTSSNETNIGETPRNQSAVNKDGKGGDSLGPGKRGSKRGSGRKGSGDNSRTVEGQSFYGDSSMNEADYTGHGDDQETKKNVTPKDQSRTASGEKFDSVNQNEYEGQGQTDRQVGGTGQDGNNSRDQVAVEVVPVFSDGKLGESQKTPAVLNAEPGPGQDEVVLETLGRSPTPRTPGEFDEYHKDRRFSRRPSLEGILDKRKRKFILDGICCDYLSHGYFKCNPPIQCTRPPYNAIKDPFATAYFASEHVQKVCNKTGMLDYRNPYYRGVAIEGVAEDRAYSIGEFHCTLKERNKNGCGRAYETYKGIDLYYDLPKQVTNRTFEQQCRRWQELVVPGMKKYGLRHFYDFDQASFGSEHERSMHGGAFPVAQEKLPPIEGAQPSDHFGEVTGEVQGAHMEGGKPPPSPRLSLPVVGETSHDKSSEDGPGRSPSTVLRSNEHDGVDGKDRPRRDTEGEKPEDQKGHNDRGSKDGKSEDGKSGSRSGRGGSSRDGASQGENGSRSGDDRDPHAEDDELQEKSGDDAGRGSGSRGVGGSKSGSRPQTGSGKSPYDTTNPDSRSVVASQPKSGKSPQGTDSHSVVASQPPEKADDTESVVQSEPRDRGEGSGIKRSKMQRPSLGGRRDSGSVAKSVARDSRDNKNMSAMSGPSSVSRSPASQSLKDSTNIPSSNREGSSAAKSRPGESRTSGRHSMDSTGQSGSRAKAPSETYEEEGEDGSSSDQSSRKETRYSGHHKEKGKKGLHSAAPPRYFHSDSLQTRPRGSSRSARYSSEVEDPKKRSDLDSEMTYSDSKEESTGSSAPPINNRRKKN